MISLSLLLNRLHSESEDDWVVVYLDHFDRAGRPEWMRGHRHCRHRRWMRGVRMAMFRCCSLFSHQGIICSTVRWLHMTKPIDLEGGAKRTMQTALQWFSIIDESLWAELTLLGKVELIEQMTNCWCIRFHRHQAYTHIDDESEAMQTVKRRQYPYVVEFQQITRSNNWREGIVVLFFFSGFEPQFRSVVNWSELELERKENDPI